MTMRQLPELERAQRQRQFSGIFKRLLIVCVKFRAPQPLNEYGICIHRKKLPKCFPAGEPTQAELRGPDLSHRACPTRRPPRARSESSKPATEEHGCERCNPATASTFSKSLFLRAHVLDMNVMTSFHPSLFAYLCQCVSNRP